MPVESNSGRGATRNAIPKRFNLQERVTEGEWLDQVEALDGVTKRRTTVTIEHPKSILTRNNSPDIGFDRSINAFRGCEHGCRVTVSRGGMNTVTASPRTSPRFHYTSLAAPASSNACAASAKVRPRSRSIAITADC